MGPKNSAAAACTSAPPPRDLSWIDRMYIKLETMCVEVDKNPSLLIQETSKYVESQVNAVGANVKKLCTELIQDLISTPMLSPEGVEKKLECALHCKCHCMDSERLKLVGTDATDEAMDICETYAAGVEDGDDTLSDIVHQKQGFMKKEGNKVGMPDIVQKEVSNLETLNVDVTREPESSEVSSPELKSIHGQDGTDNEQILITAIGQVEMEDVGVHKNCDEKLGLAKSIKNYVVQHGQLEGNRKSCDTGENKSTSEGSVKVILERAGLRNEAVVVGQGSKPKEYDYKQLVGANDLIAATHINGATNACVRSQEDKWRPETLEFRQEMQVRNAKGHCKGPVSDSDCQHVLNGGIELHLNVDTHHAKCKYDSTSSAEDMQAEKMKDTIKVGGSFQAMHTYDFKDVKRITLSEPFSKEDVPDEEQSAHWFVCEDLRKALQPEIFSVEKARHEFDLDWELL